MALRLKYWVEFISEATWVTLELSLWEGFHYEFNVLDVRQQSDYFSSVQI